jgi:SulP family sulfate permease
VFSIVFLFARYARYIPIPALAAIVMHVAYDMINPEQIRIAFRSTRSDVIVLLSTFFAIILFDLQVALYAGIAFHVIFFLRQSSQPNITRLLSHPDGSFREVPITSSEKQRPVEIIQFEGALFFGAERAVERIINTFLNNVTTPHVVVFRMKRTHHFDANFIVMFSKIIKRFRSRNIPLLFCGVHSELQLLFDLSGLTQLIGEDFIFTAQENLFESTTEAIQYAYILLDKGMER